MPLSKELSVYDITEGRGDPNEHLILFNRNGIGDAIHAMPAVWQKVQSGIHCTVHHKPFTCGIWERLGCEFVDEAESNRRPGLLKKLQKQYGRIYSATQSCVNYERAMGWNISLTRFEQYAHGFETSVPEFFDFKQFILPDAMPVRRESILFSPRASIVNRRLDHVLTQRIYETLSMKFPQVEFIGYQRRKFDTPESFATAIFNAKLVIGTDSGVINYALALGVPCLALLGGSDEASIISQFSKYRSLANVRVLKADSARVCDIRCMKKPELRCDCLNDLTPTSIVEAALQLTNQ